MLTFRRPTDRAIAHFLAAQRGLALTYEAEGMTRRSSPSGYNTDHLRRKLGSGHAAFERAVAELRSWTMFRLGWVHLESGGRPPDVGLVVAVVVRIGFVWWAN